jgi:hypothetical protein
MLKLGDCVQKIVSYKRVDSEPKVGSATSGTLVEERLTFRTKSQGKLLAESVRNLEITL